MLSHKLLGGVKPVSAACRTVRSRRTRRLPRSDGALRRFEALEDRRLLSLAPEWVVGITGVDFSEPYLTAVGPDGDVYVAGGFHQTADFDPLVDHSDEGDPDILTSLGSSDGFVARYNSAGDFVWATSMGGPGGGGSPLGIDVDKNGNLYIFGKLATASQLGDDLVGPGGFVTRLDSNGAFDWAVTAVTAGFGGGYGDITVDDSAADPTDWSVYTTSSFVGVGQVGDEPVDTGPNYQGDGFVLKLKAAEATGGNSQFVWTQVIDGGGPRGIALDPPANPGDEASLYVTGNFGSKAKFGDFRLNAAKYRYQETVDIFVTRMDADGNFLWAERMGGISGDFARAIAVTDGNAYVTGDFGWSIPHGYDGPITAEFGSFTLTATGIHDAFVEKIDATGNVLWVQQVTALGSLGNDIAAGANHEMFLTGNFGGDAIFPDGTVLSDPNDGDGFLAEIDALGNFLSARQLGGEGEADPGGAAGDAVTVDDNGNVYVTGSIQGTAEFPTGDVLSVDHGYRMYLLKFAREGQGNNPPTAVADGPYSGTEDAAIVFDASGSSDPDAGDTLRYTWDFGDGNSITTTNLTVSYSYLWGGTFDVTLTVNDGNGGMATDTTSATVAEVNDAPVADAGGPYGSMEGVPITFDGSGSYDYDNQDGTSANDQALSHEWDFDYDGVTFNVDATGVTISHTYAIAGSYTVGLRVDDGNGGTHTDTTMATVTTSGWTIDDGDPAYGERYYPTNSYYWTIVANQGGHAGLDQIPDYRKHAKSPRGTSQEAYWTFSDLSAGTYEVLATWVAQSDGASNTPYKIVEDGTLLRSVRADHGHDPVGPDGFQSLGTVDISSGTLTVWLSAKANGTVVADAVRVVPLSSESASSASAGPAFGSASVMLITAKSPTYVATSGRQLIAGDCLAAVAEVFAQPTDDLVLRRETPTAASRLVAIDEWMTRFGRSTQAHVIAEESDLSLKYEDAEGGLLNDLAICGVF